MKTAEIDTSQGVSQMSGHKSVSLSEDL